jgi:hypothetical protein
VVAMMQNHRGFVEGFLMAKHYERLGLSYHILGNKLGQVRRMSTFVGILRRDFKRVPI